MEKLSRRWMVVALLVACLATAIALGVLKVLGEENVARVVLGVLGLIAWELRRPPPAERDDDDDDQQQPRGGGSAASIAAGSLVALALGELGAALASASP